jgi:alpha-N-arabinofuranosidase
MPTFGAWENTVLDLAWDVADHISLHAYFDPESYDDVDAYLACPDELDRAIGDVIATADAVAARKRSRRRVSVSVDEWNVWYFSRAPDRRDAPFEEAPPLIEDTYTALDAVVVGGLLITLLRRADRVRIACLAQLVNVIAPIRTENGGPAWRQTTFAPFRDVARNARGTVLQVATEPPIHATAVHDGDRTLTVFAVNRAAEPVALEVVPHGFGRASALRAELEPRSWNLLRLPDAA